MACQTRWMCGIKVSSRWTQAQRLWGSRFNAARRQQPYGVERRRTEPHHEPASTTCGCGCQMKHISEDMAEKLDYTPGTFSIERHIRGKWACAQCETLIQAPVPTHSCDRQGRARWACNSNPRALKEELLIFPVQHADET